MTLAQLSPEGRRPLRPHLRPHARHSGAQPSTSSSLGHKEMWHLPGCAHSGKEGVGLVLLSTRPAPSLGRLRDQRGVWRLVAVCWDRAPQGTGHLKGRAGSWRAEPTPAPAGRARRRGPGLPSGIMNVICQPSQGTQKSGLPALPAGGVLAVPHSPCPPPQD